MGIENPIHLLFLAAVALIVLGPKRLPELARAAGKGMREFRESLNGESSEETPGPAGAQATAQAPPALPAGDQSTAASGPAAPAPHDGL